MNDDSTDPPLPLSYGSGIYPPIGERVSRVEQVTIDHERRIGGLEKDVHEIKESTFRIETTLGRIEDNVGKTSKASEEASEKVPAQVASKGLVYFVEKLVLPVVCAIVIGLILKFL